MATAEALVLAVQAIVQDPAYTTTEILPFINEGMQILATEVQFPTLDTVATVATDTVDCYANMPSNYAEGIYSAMDGDIPLTVYDKWSDLQREYVDLTQTGDVQAVAVKGVTLMYMPIPETATDITIFYYRMPTALVALTEIDMFTKKNRIIGEQCLKHYAAYRCFNIIEDGIEGPKVNTSKWEAEYLRDLTKLKSMGREGVSGPRPSRNKLW